MRQLTDTIIKLKSESSDSIKAQQISSIPCYDNNMFERQVFEYLDEGKRTLIDQTREVCLKLRYVYLKNMPRNKYMNFLNSTFNLQFLVENEFIHPFMLFINGRFIKWSDIFVISKQEFFYLMIRPMDTDLFESIHMAEDVKIIQIPFNISYWEGFAAEMTEETIFAFTHDGYSTMTEPYVSIVNMDSNLYHNEWQTDNGINAYPVLGLVNYKMYPENLILFKNGSPTQASLIEFSSTLLTIDGGKNENSDNLNFKLFYNLKCNLSNDNISKASLKFLQPQVKNRNDGVSYNDQLEKLETSFNIKMDKTENYENNISNAISNILKYNSGLLDEVYIKNSNLDIIQTVGKWVNEKASANNGVLAIPRRHDDEEDNYVIMLVNGELYKHYYTHTYYANKFTVPIMGINDDDQIEFLFFKNVNNKVLSKTINDNDPYENIDESVVNSNMMIFSPETNETYFKFPVDGQQNFPVEYTLIKDDKGYTKIQYKDPFYYGKPVKISYYNQFRYFGYKITSPANELRISLGDNFMYCPEYAKYSVFLNGRRLGSDQFRLTIPSRVTTPFYRYEIYLSKQIKEDDVVEIFYLPSLMKDVIMYPTMPITGDIILDKTKISYNFNKELYMIWVNGKKIPKAHIMDISSTRLKIIHDEESIKTVCATKYIPDSDYLTPIFKDNEALWDSIITNLSDSEIYDLLSIIGVDISDTEIDVYAGAIPMATIMWELIREHYMANPNVDIADGFIYDYQDVDNTAIEGYDSAGNAILPAYDSNKHDNLDPVERPWP